MKIVYILPNLMTAGGVRVVFEHANRLTKQGHIIKITSIDGAIGQNWFPLNVEVVPYKNFIHHSESFDIAIATAWQTAPVVLSLPISHKFYFVQMRESLFYDDLTTKRDSEGTYLFPLRFLTVSKWLQKMLRKDFGQDSEIIPNGVNRQMFYPEPLFLKKRRFRVLIEGSHNFYKGVIDAYKALKGLPVEIWSVSQHGPMGKVDRSFVLPSQDLLRRIYSSCDVLLKTSWYEGRPCPHVEAMACGLPVISTEMLGTDDLIDGKNCILVPARDIKAIRQAMVQLLNNASLREKLRKGGLETARKLDWEKSVAKLEMIFDRELKTKPTILSLNKKVEIFIFNNKPLGKLRKYLRFLRTTIPRSSRVNLVNIHKNRTGLDILKSIKNVRFYKIKEYKDFFVLWSQVLSRSKAHYTVFISSEVKFAQKDWLINMTRVAEENSQVGIVGPKLVSKEGRILSTGGYLNSISNQGKEMFLGHYGWLEPLYYRNVKTECDFILSDCMLLTKNAFKAVSDLDIPFIYGNHDYEFCTKIRRYGLKVVYTPTTVIEHEGSRFPTRQLNLHRQKGILEQELQKLHLSLYEKERQLKEIQSSRSWKVIAFLHNIRTKIPLLKNV